MRAALWGAACMPLKVAAQGGPALSLSLHVARTFTTGWAQAIPVALLQLV